MYMGSDNGLNGSMKLISWVGGIVGLLITIYSVFYVPQNKAIAAESLLRQQGDDEIRKEQMVCVKEQTNVNQQILLALQDIKTEQRVTKELIKNGRNN
jgi:hypothetical protein